MGPTASRKKLAITVLILGVLSVTFLMSTRQASEHCHDDRQHFLLQNRKLKASAASLNLTTDGAFDNVTAADRKTLLNIKASHADKTTTMRRVKAPNRTTTSATVTSHLSTSHTTTLEAKYNGAESMRIRAEEIRRRCKTPDRGRQPMVVGNEYLVTLGNQNYAYYPIAKCGWTTWTYIMFNAVGKPDEPNEKGFEIGWRSPFEHAGMKRRKIQFQELQQYKERMLFVRDPYDRLVSAYKNKILYGTYNVVFGVPCTWLKPGMPAPTFPQFVQCILDKSNRVAKRYRVPLSSKRVANSLDIHWTPQYWTSLPCDSKYTLVGRFEHLNEDIVAAMGIIKLNASVPHENSSHKNASVPLSYWYNQLPLADRNSLKQLYKYDFEIFGFSSTVPS